MSKLSALKARFASATPKTAEPATPVQEGSALLIVKLLASKAFDPSGVAAVIDGRQVTYGDLKADRRENYHRPNGTVGVHYPTIFSLSHAQADQIITALKAMPSKDGAKPRRRQSATPTAAPAQPATPVESSELSALRADMSALIDIVAALAEGQSAPAEPAEPVEGHAKVAEPAEPVLPTVINLAPGQVVMINGELRQVSPDGKRLNKTIV